MSGTVAQRGFIYQTIIAMIECLERDDWDQVKLEPDTKNHLDKIDLQLYQVGRVIKAIQVKSSQNKFSEPDVKRWLEAARADAADADEVALYLVGDSYTSNCEEYIKSSSEIKTYPFVSLDIQCRLKLQDYIAREGRGSQVDEEDLRVAYNNLFAEIHNNSISLDPFSREEFRGWLLRVLSFPKCLTDVPSINRSVGLVGRENELCELREMLDKDGCIALVSGLGGIGKTAVMRWICNSIKEDGNAKNHVAWVTCGASLQKDLLLLKESLGISEGGTAADDYKKIIYKLRNFKGTLYLFMDNMSRIPDAEEMKTLNSLQPAVHIMITARHRIEDIPCKDLDTLEPESALIMFYKYYERDLERRYETSARNIVDTVRYHTLLVELLARAAGKSGGTLEDFRENLEKNGFFDVFTRQIKTKHDEYLTIEDSIIKLYKISGLTESQQHVMRLFSIFTPEKEIYWKAAEWADLDMKAVDELVDRAWLGRGGLENGYFIHQIIRDSVARQVGASLKIEEYGELLDRVIATKSYMPRNLEYTDVQERLVLTEDVAEYLWTRTEVLLKNEDYLEEDKELIMASGALFNNVAGVYADQGDYEKALENYGKALSISERVLGAEHPLTATTYNNMAGVYRAQGEYEKALGYYGKALAIRERVLGAEHPLTATTYNNMALVYASQGYYEKALEHYGKALAIHEYVSGADHPDTGATHNNMALLYYYQGEYEKALEHYGRALAISERVLGTQHPDTATTYNNMALVFSNQGEYEKALEHYVKALSIREKVLGPEHPDTGATYNNMAMVYAYQGYYEKALEHYGKALAISERVLGTEHPDTATMYNNMAMVYAYQGDYEKALEHYGKALAIRERVLGPEHPDTATTYNNMALVYSKQGDYEKALKYYGKALVIKEKVLGPEHPDTATTYNNMAGVYEDQGEYKKALENYVKALSISERVLGPEHPLTATMYNNIAGVYEDQGDYEKALEYYGKALSIRERVLGSEHPDTGATYSNIAGVYYYQGDYEKALENHVKAQFIRERVLGPQHPDTGETYNNMALVYSDQGNYEMALEKCVKALSICERVLGPEHPSTITTYNNMACVYYDQGDYKRALEYFEKALAMRKMKLGINHPDTQNTMKWIEAAKAHL